MKKLIFKNGSSIAFCGTGGPEAGRGLKPFEPHPCQDFEIEVAGVVTKINLKEVEQSWVEHARTSSKPTSFAEHVLGYAFKFPESKEE